MMDMILSKNINLKPSLWIIDYISSLPENVGLKILDFASGSGRHSINLARNHFVTAIDKDLKKIRTYKNFKNIEVICFDLETSQQWPLTKNYYDIIIISRYLYRPKIKNLIKLLKVNGILIYETFSEGNEKYGPPKSPDFLLKDRELIDIFSDSLEVLYYFNGKVVENGTSKMQKCILKRRLI